MSLFTDLIKKLENLEKEKQNIYATAKQENVSEYVNAYDLQREYNKFLPKYPASTYPFIYLGDHDFISDGSVDSAKKYILENNLKLYVSFGFDSIAPVTSIAYVKDVLLSNGEKLIDHITNKLKIPKNMEKQIMVNIKFNEEILTKLPDFKQSVLNCVELRELEDSLIEHIKNQ